MPAWNYQVVDVLQLVGIVAPIATYFLFLGLVNSHAKPYLLTSRSDFISLTVVLAPILLWPVLTFAQAGMGWLLAVGSFLAWCIFLRMLPARDAGLVIYNISEADCKRSLEAAIEHLGWQGRWQDGTWFAQHGGFKLVVRGFALLRNVTIHVEGDVDRRRIPSLQAELQRRISAVSQLPSMTGACLVILGVGLMILPMWTVGRHIDDLVDAMSYLFG